jgi:6-phosphogluconolactonase
MSHPPEIEIAPDTRSLAERAARRFLHLLGSALRIRDRFTVALAGGSTPRQLFSLLAEKKLDWEGVHFFWGDERCVPPDAADSNFRMADESLLSHASIPEENIHRIHGELPAEKAAIEYKDELHRFFGYQTPRFDLILLGLGDDGHTASLFPGSPILQDKARWVAAVEHPLPPLVLNAAAYILFLVSGEKKAGRLAQVLQGPFHPDRLPAQVVEPGNGHVCWLVDQAAAGKLIPSR